MKTKDKICVGLLLVLGVAHGVLGVYLIDNGKILDALFCACFSLLSLVGVESIFSEYFRRNGIKHPLD